MIEIATLKTRWMKDPEFKAEYDGLEEEFALIGALIAARSRAKLSQADVAERMHTKQTAIARLESGRANPSVQTLQNFATATGTRLKISFEPC